MKNLSYLLILLFVLMTPTTKAQKLHPSKDNIACLWGMRNDSGKWVVTPKYIAIERTYDGLYLAMLGEKWSLLSAEGKELIPLLYDKLYLIPVESNDFSNAAARRIEVVAIKEGKSGLVDLSGKILIPFQYDGLWREQYENYFHIVVDKKMGLRNYEKELLPCRYPYLERVANTSLFIVAGNDLNRSPTGINVGLINLTGDTLVPCRFNALKIPNQQGYETNTPPRILSITAKALLITAHRGDTIGMYDFSGKCLLEPKYVLANVTRFDAYGNVWYNRFSQGEECYYEGDPRVFSENGKLGIVTPGKGVIQPAVFDSVYIHLPSYARPGFYRVRKNGRWGLLNADGTTLLPCDFRQISFYPRQIFVFEKEEKIREYNWRSNKILPKVYQKILPVSNAYNDLVSDYEFYSNCDDTVIHRCKILARLTDDISIINPGDGVEGKGSQARHVEISSVRYGSSYYFSVLTKKGNLLCDENYRVILPPGKYQSFYGLYDARNIVVVSRGGKVGMIDSTGKTVIDTVFEAIGTGCTNGMIFVKPPTQNKSSERACADGWAISDTTGKLLTRPIIRATELSKYQARQLLITSEGVGVFDIYERRFVTPTNFINGLFTGAGCCIMQTRDSLFLPIAFDGKPMSAKAWKGLLHVAGDRETDHYRSDYDIIDGRIVHDSTKLEDAWLLVNDDSLVILNRGELIRNRQAVLKLLYDYFRIADERDLPQEHLWSYYPRHEAVMSDCPRLETGEEPLDQPFFLVTTIPADTFPETKKNHENNSINDSLILHIVRSSVSKVEYPLYPNHMFSCNCFAAGYEHSVIESPHDRRQIRSYPFSVYYRVVHRSAGLISLQGLENYNYGDYSSSAAKHYSNRSYFENHAIGKNGWRPLQLSQLFKPGYEKLLNAEIVTAIQKADSLELDCRNPATYLEQCEGRFSFSDKGLFLYLDDNSSFEFAPMLIPWNRIRSIIPPQSPAATFLKK